jgi:hypothetical protein
MTCSQNYHDVAVTPRMTTPECVYQWFNLPQLAISGIYIDPLLMCGPGSSVGIATGYGLDGPGIESRWG